MLLPTLTTIWHQRENNEWDISEMVNQVVTSLTEKIKHDRKFSSHKQQLQYYEFATASTALILRSRFKQLIRN